MFGLKFKHTISVFVDVALRTASTLQNLDLFFLQIVFTLQNSFTCLDLGLRSSPEVLVLKNAVECTSQRHKWTSEARVMIFMHDSCPAGLMFHDLP